MKNKMRVEFLAKPVNEGFARMMIAGFVMGLDPTVQELEDVRTAVSEAVSNVIIHAYPKSEGTVKMEAVLEENELTLTISDDGVGIEDIAKARQAMFTTCPELERSGMGFTFMELFMDTLTVTSEKGKGSTIRMTKRFGEPFAYE